MERRPGAQAWKWQQGWRGWPLGVLLLLGAPTDSRAGEGLVVQLEGTADCPSLEVLARALRDALPEDVKEGPSPSADAPHLRLAVVAEGEVEVSLGWGPGQPRLERRLVGNRQECGALARAAAMLVEAWLRRPAPLVATAQEPGPAPAPPPDTPPAMEAVPEAAPVALPTAIVEVPPAAAPPRLSLRAMGTSGWLANGHQAFGARLEADVTLAPHVAVGAHVSSELPRRQAAGGGEVHASAHALGAHVRLTPWGPGVSGPELAVGVRLEALAATSPGYPQPAQRLLLDPSLWGAVGWHQPLGTRFFLVPSVGVSARPRDEVLGVEHVGEVLPLPALAFQAGLGLGWGAF